MTRLEFLRLSASASIGWLASAGQSPTSVAAQDGASGRVARVSRIIEQYDGQGVHRTGTATDNQSARWLRDAAAEAGGAAAIESFTLDRVDVQSGYVEVGGRRIDGLPLFDGTFTSAAGIAGPLGTAGTGAAIGLTSANAAGISSEGRAIEALRRGDRHQAIVVVTGGAHPGLTPMNAAAFTRPYGVPVLQVSSDDGAWLRQRAADGVEARVVAHAERTRTEAANVVATVRGTGAALPEVVVITPRSGWWQCAAERGGGIACWLEAIRTVRDAAPPRTVVFAASSGHELGHLGLESFLEARRGLIRRASAWVHLGANIGAAKGTPRLQASDDAIEARAAEALSGAGVAVGQRVPRGTVPAGEARNLHVGGARYVSLLGSSPFFHSQADRWPTAVDAPAVARFAAGIANLVVGLARP